MIVKIECPDLDSAESLARSFKKHTIRYKVIVVLDSSGNPDGYTQYYVSVEES